MLGLVKRPPPATRYVPPPSSYCFPSFPSFPSRIPQAPTRQHHTPLPVASSAHPNSPSRCAAPRPPTPDPPQHIAHTGHPPDPATPHRGPSSFARVEGAGAAGLGCRGGLLVPLPPFSAPLHSFPVGLSELRCPALSIVTSAMVPLHCTRIHSFATLYCVGIWEAITADHPILVPTLPIHPFAKLSTSGIATEERNLNKCYRTCALAMYQDTGHKTCALPSQTALVLCKDNGARERTLFQTQGHNATTCAYMRL